MRNVESLPDQGHTRSDKNFTRLGFYQKYSLLVAFKEATPVETEQGYFVQFPRS